MLVGGCIWELEKERPHNRHAGARHFFDGSIEIRHQFVTFFDIAAANIFLLGPVHPRLTMRYALFAVIAIDRLKRRQFRPLGEELGSRRTNEAATVRAAHSKATEAEVLEHRSGQTQMVPGGAVIAG